MSLRKGTSLTTENAEDGHTKDATFSPTNSSSGVASDDSSQSEADAARLAEMGYSQDMERKFSIWSLLGVGFSLTNSWFGVSAALITGLDSGGPVLLVYGIILMFFVSLCIGASLSELASAFPSAAGQIYWASELAPSRYENVASYVVGWCSWVGSIFTSASVALAMGYAVVGCYQLSHPEYTIEPWNIFVAYQLINLTIFFLNCWGKVLPGIAKVTLYVSLASFLVIIITVPASAPTHQRPSFVFGTFINNTGWQNPLIAFAVGLINTNWAFSCLDCATHLAEEISQPEKMIPIAIMSTVGIGFITAWCYVVSMFFSVGDFELLRNTATSVPILELFHQALAHRAGAITLESLIIITGLGCLNASHTWQSRLCWSFARDRGLPMSSWLSTVNETLDVPLYAHMFSCSIVALVGCLFLGSETAFNSMVTACIVLLYVSYSVPVTCLLIKGRDNIKHGPFWLGRLGFLANLVLLGWIAFTVVMYSFPVRLPITARNMNYVSVVYVVVGLIMCMDWFARARKEYRDQGAKSEDEEPILRSDD